MGVSVQPDPNVTKKPQAGQAGGIASPLSLAPQQAASSIPAPTVASPSAPVDRLSLAQSNFNNIAQSTAPAYDASLRAAESHAAESGQLGSGQLRTSLGDLSLARARDLDTQRSDLLNKATEGSIADASTAFQQSLAGAQQGLASELGHGNLSIAQQQADTAKTGTLGNLDVAKGGLELAKSGQAANIDQSQQQIDLAKKTADINAQYQAGTLTLAQKDQALRELQNTENVGLEGARLELARTGQAADIANQQGQLELARSGQQQQGQQFAQSQAQQQAQFQASNDLARAAQSNQASQFTQTLAQNATQFGLSLEQARALATLADTTANRQLDITSDLGKRNLLVQLIGVLGGPTGTANANTIQAITNALGVSPAGVTPGTLTGGTGTPYVPIDISGMFGGTGHTTGPV